MASLVRIELLPRESLVDAWSYTELLRAILALFRETDASLAKEAGKTGHSLRWLLSSLRSSNPTMELLAESIFEDIDLSSQVISRSQESLVLLQERPVRPDWLPYAVLERCQEIGDLIRRDSVSEIAVSSNERSVQVTERLDANVREIMGQKIEVMGSLEGELAMVTLRGRPYFNVYSLATGKATRCYFSDELREHVRYALGSIVIVKGLIRSFAHEEGQEVHDITEMTVVQEESLPTVDDARGIFPNLTGGLPSEQYLKERWRGRKQT